MTQRPEDEAYENYDFGKGVEAEGADGWEREYHSNTKPGDIQDITRIVYVRYDDDEEDSDTHRLSFHAKVKDGKLIEAYALSMDSGCEIGVPFVADKKSVKRKKIK